MELQKIKLGQEIEYTKLVEDEFKQYLLLGGMPEVIADFNDHHDFGRVREILTRIQSTYIEDIGKYLKAKRNESIWKQ